MFLISTTVLITLVSVFPFSHGETGLGEIIHDWPKGFTGRLSVTMEEDVKEGWTMTLGFSKALKRLEIWRARVVSRSDDGKVTSFSIF